MGEWPVVDLGHCEELQSDLQEAQLKIREEIRDAVLLGGDSTLIRTGSQWAELVRSSCQAKPRRRN
jgi:hypothetical protein